MPATVRTGETRSDQLATVAAHPDAWPRLVAALAAFRAHGERAERGIAYLEGLLRRQADLPLDAFEESRLLAQRYLRYRWGPAPGGQASIRDLVVAGWGKAVECRIAYRHLTDGERAQATMVYGAFTDKQHSDNPLWHLCFPQRRLDALDARAAGQGIVGVQR